MKINTAVLRDNPLFCGLTEDDITNLLRETGAGVVSKKADEYIMHAGDATA